MQSNTSQEPVYPSFHGSRKHKRTTLLILSGLCLLACGVLVSMGVVSAKQGGGPLRSVELTSQSTKAKYAEFLDFLPSEMRELVDDNVDPCDNFHKWACGSWEDEEKIPADRSGWAFAWDGDAEDISHELQDLMVKDHGKPGAYYRACMNTDLVEHLGLAPAKPWLGVVDSINDLESFAVVLAKFHRAEVGVFFDWWLATDDHDPTRMLLMVDQGGLDLPDETYYNVNSTKNLEHRRVYRHFLTQLYGLFGVDAKEAKEWANTVIRIESTMASHATDDNTMVHCPRHNLATMTKAFPNFPWNTYFKHMGSDIEVAKDFKQISLTCPKWLKAFDDLIAKEPLENIRIYLKSHFMFNVSPLLTKKFFDINLVLDKNLYGVSAHPTRHHKCVAAAKAALPFLVSKMFVEEYFPPSSKKRATAMLENIRIQFEFDLKTVTWMAEDTRTKALDKLRKIFFEVGYPSVWPQYHFEVTDKSYFQNSLRSSQWRTHSKWSRLGKPVERHRWTMSPATVNAYYDNGVNGVFVPAGLLQPPFFNLSEPMARNYGSAGAIMAHELTHGFDNSGRKYDANCRKREWWDKPTIHEYKSREKCIADYYNKFKVVGHHVDGKNTLGENIADIGGVKMAYLAFVADAAMIHRSDPSTKLDTLNHKRLFWTAFAQSWCGKNRRRVAQLNLITDVHSPDKFRIIGPLSQNVHFANDFDCAFGSTMNPMKRCNLW